MKGTLKNDSLNTNQPCKLSTLRGGGKLKNISIEPLGFLPVQGNERGNKSLNISTLRVGFNVLQVLNLNPKVVLCLFPHLLSQVMFHWNKCHIHLSMKVVCLFCLSHWELPNHGTSCRTQLLLPLESSLSMSKGAPSWFYNVSTFNLCCRSYWIINIFLLKIHSKLKIIGEFGHTLDIVGKPSLRKF